MPTPSLPPVVSADLAALLATLLMAQQLPPAKGLIFNKSEVNVGGVVVQFSDMAAHTAVRVLIGGTAMPLVSARVTCDLAADLWRHMVALPGAFAV